MAAITYGSQGTISVNGSNLGTITTADSATAIAFSPAVVQAVQFKIQNNIEQLFTMNSGATTGYVTGVPRAACTVWTNQANTSAGTFSVNKHCYLFDPGGKEWLQNNAWTWTSSGADTATTCYVQWVKYSNYALQWQQESPKDKLRRIIRERYAPAFIRDAALESAEDIREERARQTLRKVVGPDEFRRFLKRGFVLIRGRSGDVYQCFPGNWQESITKVWRLGACIERLCVVLQGDFPPTDSLIMRCLLLMNDEAQFRSLANVHKAARQTHRADAVDPNAGKSLVQIYRSLKGIAG